MRHAILFGLFALLAAAPALADEVTGEVVDTTCYLLHDGRGEGHKDCAISCAKAGTPTAVLDEKTNRLVFPIPPGMKSHHGERPDKALLPYVGQRVTMRGSLVERGGTRAMLVESVTPAR